MKSPCGISSRSSSSSPQGSHASTAGGPQLSNMSNIMCAGCNEEKPVTAFSRNQITRTGREICQLCLRGKGAAAAPPARVAPAAGEGHVRCVACCQLKPTSSFGINQLRRRAGIERCMSCVENDQGSLVLCNACQKQKPFTDFSKKQLACKPGSERCKLCIENSSA